MKFDNSKVRRQDRLLEEDEAISLLTNGEYGYLSMVDTNNSGYGIPVNYVFENKHIYIHCAPEGKKLRCLQQNNKVSFGVVGATKVISEQFTTGYSSVIAMGSTVQVLADDEKRHALELIVNKYSPNDKEVGLKMIERSFNRTNIIKIEIATVSAKCKIV